MSTLTTIQGDATKPEGDGIKLIPHICNNIGAWGAGFVLAISKKWSKPERTYKEWKTQGSYLKPTSQVLCPFKLGEIQAVKVEKDIGVINMIAQAGIGTQSKKRPPIRYCALASCMEKVFQIAEKYKASIHCPMFGSGLAGGNWEVIKQMIFESWVDCGINVIVYEHA